MHALPPKERLEVLELVTEIAASAASNHNIQFMIEFQEELIERLYRKMSTLLLEGRPPEDDGYND